MLCLIFEVASFGSFRDIPKNHFVSEAADIDDSIKQKCIRVSLKKDYELFTRIVADRLSNVPDLTLIAASGWVQNAIKYCPKMRKTGTAKESINSATV